MRFREFLSLVLVAALPAVAPTQFTTYIAPRKQVDTAKAPTVAQAKAKADTAARQALTNMKAWVDSAAGRSMPAESTSVAAVDTSAGEVTPSRPVTTFRNGSTAPATASDLPTLALIGFAALSLGTVMLAGRGRA